MHFPNRFFNSSRCSELCSVCGWNPVYSKPINASTSPVGLVISSFVTFLNSYSLNVGSYLIYAVYVDL